MVAVGDTAAFFRTPASGTERGRAGGSADLSPGSPQVRKHINDLYEDLRDGHNLISLLEVLSGVKLVSPRAGQCCCP